MASHVSYKVRYTKNVVQNSMTHSPNLIDCADNFILQLTGGLKSFQWMHLLVQRCVRALSVLSLNFEINFELLTSKCFTKAANSLSAAQRFNKLVL